MCAELADELRDGLAHLQAMAADERDRRAARDDQRDRQELMDDAQARGRTVALADQPLERS